MTLDSLSYGVKCVYVGLCRVLLWLFRLSPLYVGFFGVVSLPGGVGPFGQSYFIGIPMIAYSAIFILYVFGALRLEDVKRGMK